LIVTIFLLTSFTDFDAVINFDFDVDFYYLILTLTSGGINAKNYQGNQINSRVLRRPSAFHFRDKLLFNFKGMVDEQV